MNHSEVRSKMPGYLEGELDLTQSALLDAHLDACADCNRDFAEMRGTIALLRNLPDPEPPPFLVETVMRRIRDGEGRRSIGDRVGDFVRSLATPPVAIPATALALGLMMATGIVDPSTLRLPGLQDDPVQGFAQTQARPDRSLSSRIASASRPPAVAPAPGVRIGLPARSGGGLATPVAAGTPSAGRSFLRRSPRSIRTNVASNPLDFRVAGTPVSGGPMERAPSAFRTGSGADPYAQVVGSSGASRYAVQLESRLETMIHRPAFFAADFASWSILEQERWLRDLAAYAHEEGRGAEVIDALNRALDLRARQVATAFAAELRRIEHTNVASVAGKEPAGR